MLSASRACFSAATRRRTSFANERRVSGQPGCSEKVNHSGCALRIEESFAGSPTTQTGVSYGSFVSEWSAVADDAGEFWRRKPTITSAYPIRLACFHISVETTVIGGASCSISQRETNSRINSRSSETTNTGEEFIAFLPKPRC